MWHDRELGGKAAAAALWRGSREDLEYQGLTRGAWKERSPGRGLGEGAPGSWNVAVVRIKTES